MSRLSILVLVLSALSSVSRSAPSRQIQDRIRQTVRAQAIRPTRPFADTTKTVRMTAHQ